MSGHPGAVLCGRDHGAVDVVVQGHGQLLVGYQLEVKGHHFLAARQTPTSYAPVQSISICICMFPLCAIPTAVLKMGSELHSRDAVWTIILSAETALHYSSSILTFVWL